MSEIRDIIADSVEERLTYTGETVTHLRTGKRFVAEYQEIPDITLNEALGRDPRESATLHVSDDTAIAILNAGDVIAINFYGTVSKFQLLQGKRTNNPGSSQVEYGLMKLVPGKDQQ